MLYTLLIVSPGIDPSLSKSYYSTVIT